MKKLLVAAVFAAGLCGVSFGAECYQNNKKLRSLLATEQELEMIVELLDGDTFSAEMTYNSYCQCFIIGPSDFPAFECIDKYKYSFDSTINELKSRYKELFKKKGLKWNEANIKAEYKKARTARLRAGKSTILD